VPSLDWPLHRTRRIAGTTFAPRDVVQALCAAIPAGADVARSRTAGEIGAVAQALRPSVVLLVDDLATLCQAVPPLMNANSRSERIGVVDPRIVAGIGQHNHSAVGKSLGKLSTCGRRRQAILFARDDERRRSDPPQQRSEVLALVE
jgi:hypothetical protein